MPKPKCASMVLNLLACSLRAQKNTHAMKYLPEARFVFVTGGFRPQGHLPRPISEGFGPVFSMIRDPVKIQLSAIRLCACLGLAPYMVGICKPWRILKQLIILLHVVGDRYFCAFSNGQRRCMLNSGSGGGPAGSGVYISLVILR